MDRSTFTEAVECLLASHEKEWSSQIEELLDSLSEDARKAARDSRRHVELEHNGLVDSQGQPVEILRKYFQLTQEAGGTMMLGEMLSKLALSEAMNKAKPTLNRVWKEIFPPTPLYVAALEKAVKEVREAWQAEGISPLPQLDIKAAMGSFDWATLDVERIRDLPDVSLTNIIRQLMTVVEGVDDPSLKRRFISMVVETAEKKFQQALALDEGGDQLWKSYIIEVQRRLERTASEILGRISELEIALGARLVKDPDSGEVRTLIEVLGPRNSVDGQTRVRLPRPSREIAYISRAEFWDKYQALWSEWHGLRAVKKAWEMQYQPLHYRSLTPEGLIEPLQQEYKEAATKLAEFESQINQIEADLFAMAERARQISDESFGG